jgi:hypothetical protein
MGRMKGGHFLDPSSGPLVVEDQMGLSRQCPERSAHQFHIFQDADGSSQAVAIDEPCFGRDNRRPDVGAGAQHAVVAKVCQAAQVTGGDETAGLLLRVPEPVERGEKEAAGIHDAAAAVAVGAVVHHLALEAFGIVFVYHPEGLVN